jgi:hypothetical protein
VRGAPCLQALCATFRFAPRFARFVTEIEIAEIWLHGFCRCRSRYHHHE